MLVTVTREGDGSVACITLNRPDAFNALTRDLLTALRGELQNAFLDHGVRSIVVTGEGRAFSAGQDLQELMDELHLPLGGNDTRLREGYGPLAMAIGDAPKPVVAAVNGVAAGAGLALAALCTARVASTKAAFVPAFIELGLVPDTGASYTIPGLVGTERAVRWLIDGRKLDASEALAWGLVDRVVEHDDVVAAAVMSAQQWGSRDPRAVAMTQALVQGAARADLGAALTAETAEQITATARPEFREALIRLADR